VDATLRDRIRGSQCIVAFLSPRYLESEWCRKEMTTFVELVGGGTANDRVFLVELLPTEREQWDRGISSITAMKFWGSSLDQPEPMILGWPAPNPKADKTYWTGLNRLADILAKQIKNIPPETHPIELIWVADPTDDVLEYWTRLATALRDLQYGVLPNAAHSYTREDEDSYRKALASDLGMADCWSSCSVTRSGRSPPGPTRLLSNSRRRPQVPKRSAAASLCLPGASPTSGSKRSPTPLTKRC
jgi:hypothetical protein